MFFIAPHLFGSYMDQLKISMHIVIVLALAREKAFQVDDIHPCHSEFITPNIIAILIIQVGHLCRLCWTERFEKSICMLTCSKSRL